MIEQHVFLFVTVRRLMNISLFLRYIYFLECLFGCLEFEKKRVLSLDAGRSPNIPRRGHCRRTGASRLSSASRTQGKRPKTKRQQKRRKASAKRGLLGGGLVDEVNAVSQKKRKWSKLNYSLTG